jgi:hypothetical protein
MKVRGAMKVRMGRGIAVQLRVERRRDKVNPVARSRDTRMVKVVKRDVRLGCHHVKETSVKVTLLNSILVFSTTRLSVDTVNE